MNTVSIIPGIDRSDSSPLHLDLEVREPLVVAFLEPYEEPERTLRALEALKVGVIALQTACPTLDAQIVKDELAEMENRFAQHAEAFQKDLGESLARYFNENEGEVPKSLNGLFGDKGVLTMVFQDYFDPKKGQFVQLMDGQIGPSSKFGRLFDPQNKEGVIVIIEEKVKDLVEQKLNGVLREFSLDHDDSAMSRLNKMIQESVTGLGQALGIKAARAEESERGHVKGIDFEADLYAFVAGLGRQFGDQTQSVRGTPGALKRKTGDHLVTLGETTGAPGVRIVIEAKDQKYKAKEAIEELQEAKKNRGAVSGVFVFAKGCEPVEFGNFKRIENDFYCTVEKDELLKGGSLPFLWGAYEIVRALAVAAARKEANGKTDVERIRQHMDALATWIPSLAEIIAKANTIQKSGSAIETTANQMREQFEKRIKDILALLQSEAV